MEKRLFGIRGAVCAENTAESISAAVGELCSSLFTDNLLAADDIVSIQFTVTDDLTALNPATALRHSKVGNAVSGCALFCSQEAKCDRSLPCTIRVLVTAYMDGGAQPRAVYIRGAEKLRPDLAGK